MACADVAQDPRARSSRRGQRLCQRLRGQPAQAPGLRPPVFKAMASFGVGEETTNGADGLLVYGKDDSKLRRLRALVAAIRSTARRRFRAPRTSYLEGDEGARLDGGAADFLEMLEDQRRRLFFTLPEGEPGYPLWSMTAFRFAGDYLELIEAPRDKKPSARRCAGARVRGLNRVMTGLLWRTSTASSSPAPAASPNAA